MPEPRHFLDLRHLPSAELRGIIDTSRAMKNGGSSPDFSGRTLAMIFEKPSTRTRVSFEVAMKQLGGDVVVMSAKEMQLGRGESVSDTARVLSRYVDGIMIRTFDPETLAELAEHATVPVINGLTNRSHPCQLMADLLTIEEHRGPIAGKTVAWCGDGNNMAFTWIEAATRFDFTLRLACPEPLSPPAEMVDWARRHGASIEVTTAIEDAVDDATVVVTDAWVSMGDKDAANRHNLLTPFQVNGRIMGLARPDAIFMHCLPAHRGEEVTEAVIDGPASVVFDEAENRLHAQKGILAWCLGAADAAAALPVRKAAGG